MPDSKPFVSEIAPPAGRGDDLANRSNLSRSQLLIWTGQQLNPDAPLYNMVLTFEISGSVNLPAFRRAFQALVDTSDAMRTQIIEIDGVPQRRVVEPFRYEVEELDLSAQATPDSDLEAWVRARSRLQFQLDERLFDTVIVKLSNDRFVWYFNQHHLITDGWSVALSYRRLVELYQRARAGNDETPTFPTFESYVAFEREARQSSSFAKASSYWRDKLEQSFDPTEFYGSTLVDRVPRTERLGCELGRDRSEKLKALAMEPGVRALTTDLSRFNIFMTALFAYLHVVAGNGDLAVLTPAHNRPTPAFKNTLGLFIEIFPLHVRVEEGETFASLLSKVMRETQRFLAHARPGTSTPTHSKSYDVLLNYIHSSFRDFDGLPMRSEWVHPGHGDPTHSLRLQVHDFDDSGNFVLYFDLNCGVFGDFERQAVVRHFLSVLDALLEDRHQPVARVDLLTDRERHELCETFDGADITWTHPSIVGEFEARAKNRPEAMAIVCEGRTVTFSELNRRANRLAHHIERLDLAPETLVAIYLPRSPELVVAMLATLKAGCAYVPIDLQTPRERVAMLLADSRAAVVLTHASLADELPAAGEAHEVVLDRDGPAIEEESPSNLSTRLGSSRLAYVTYTSGSTGRPKGVMVEHGALLNYACWARQYYAGGKPVDFPLFTSVGFDLTVTSIYVPLISGGRIVIYPENSETHDLTVLCVLAEDAVDAIKLTPAHFSLLRDHDLRATRLKTIIVGGEDLKCELARVMAARLGDHVAIYNEYGPTEATVGCLIHRFDDHEDLVGSVPIGLPVANSRIYLIDRDYRLVATGIAGEIAIAGAGLARGYLGQSDQTAARFVDNPFEPGSCMYLTGDRARRLASGELVFLGRADNQVKIRGARVELAEIESVLASHPGLADSVVDVVEMESPAETVVGATPRKCFRCGLAEEHPQAKLDDEDLCTVCRRYDEYRERAARYFKTQNELRKIFEATRPREKGNFDCLMLLSGGKDSTYALYQLAAMGLDVLVFSLDNGYISDGAKQNIRRVVDDLGLELVFGSTPAMNRIFADSLERYSNVCNGCFKTIYTMSLNLARERGIGFIVTGLSRGQIFETRLADLFANGVFDPDEIDRTIVEARKAYHRMDDVVRRCLDVDLFKNDGVFDEIQFLDFYRYCDVGLEEMLSFLRDRAPWIRPEEHRALHELPDQRDRHLRAQERAGLSQLRTALQLGCAPRSQDEACRARGARRRHR